MSKIITCISGPGLLKAKEQLDGKPIGELRLDLVNLTLEEIKMLWKHTEEWILTLRKDFLKTPEWKAVFKGCLDLNPLYVDVDFELEDELKSEVKAWVKDRDLELIYSHHNFDKTPDFEELNQTVKTLFSAGADVVKLACMANSEEDNLIMMDLYREHKRLVAFCMGEEGKESRVTSLFFGEKLTYAAPAHDENVAPGQFTYGELYELINFGFDE